MSDLDHEQSKNGQLPTQAQEGDRKPARNAGLRARTRGLALGGAIAVLAPVAAVLILQPDAWGRGWLLGAFIVALIFALIIVGLGFAATPSFFSRKGKPGGPVRASMTKSSVGRTVDEERHPLRNGDGIPHAHLWWF